MLGLLLSKFSLYLREVSSSGGVTWTDRRCESRGVLSVMLIAFRS